MAYCYNLGLAFNHIVERHPTKTALQFPNGSAYTFSVLHQYSNQMARFLLSSGLKPGHVVAIFNEKSIQAYALMLACLKTGIIYTNLDAASPWARLEKIINTCAPSAIFLEHTDDCLFQSIQNHSPSVALYKLHDTLFSEKIGTQEKTHLAESAGITGNHPAYIMFTSGSTGFPKGAVMSHANVLNFIAWGQTTFDVTPHDIFTNANPIYFDNSVFDFYVSIFNGASLVPLGHDLVKQPKALVEAINQSGCTIWFSVPSLLVYLLTTKALSATDFKTVTRISFGGEGFPKNKLKQLFEMVGHRITLFNVYGPTECTCICSSYIISEKDFENMQELAPLGFLAPNFSYEIISADPAHPDTGELALIGPCVGLGYYNDPDRTARSFVPNSKTAYHQIMYKTGDLVEKAANGYLHFRGRVDNQVKHMGYRIELEEIEAAFSTLSYVNEVGVIYEKLNAELGQIKAFVSVSKKEVDKNSVLNDLKQLLPSYMIPRVITLLEVLPKNANGKIDRKQLALL
ncbi:MAG: amino acid adenylation domain-containing protein [Bacteroidetes bacterium]|nr:amino acid adenylation domain-containing protein [Bacteroidota bacterium]